jgi:hypothetical protein
MAPSIHPDYQALGLTFPANLTLSTPTVATWPSEVLDFAPLTASSSDDNRPCILFIPGNPGTCLFYIDFLSRLQEKYPDHRVAAVSYAGHGIIPRVVERSAGRDMHFSDCLAGQAEHKALFVSSLLQSSSPPTSLVLLGHSIGCHLISRFLPSLPSSVNVTDTFFLTPFIQFSPSVLSQSMPLNLVASAPLLALRAILQSANALLSASSGYTGRGLRFLLCAAGGIKNANTLEVAAHMAVTPGYFRNFITLGHEEINEVPREAPTRAILEVAGRTNLHFLFAGGPDQWGPVTQMRALLRLVRMGYIGKEVGGRMVYEPAIVHDFVRDDEQIGVVVDFVEAGMRRTLNAGPLYPGVRSKL